MPMVCAGGIIIFSLLLFFKNLPGKWAPRGEDVVVGREALLKTGLNAAIALAGLLIMHVAGFIAGGVFVIAACMLAAGRRSPVLIAVFSLCVPIVLMLVLRYGLSVYLP